jgi:uncharacterized membrane protein YagU involved in acid resistance
VVIDGYQGLLCTNGTRAPALWRGNRRWDHCGYYVGICEVGAEVPLPPRTFSGGRDEFNPPYLFLRDYLGIDPTHTVYTFSEHIINPVMVTHIIFSLVFAIGYCVVAEVFPKVKLWQGYGRVLSLLSPFTGSLSLY